MSAHSALTESQLINKFESFTTKYLELVKNPGELNKQLAYKKLIDDIVEEFIKRKNLDDAYD